MKAWFWYYRGSSFEVILGAHYILQNEDTQLRNITTEKVVHQGWNSLTLANDIALLKLPTKVQEAESKQKTLLLLWPFYNSMVIHLNSLFFFIIYL